MEAVLVAVLPEDRVLEERERDHVRGGQLVPEQEVAPGEERLEERQRVRDPLCELGDPRAVRLRLPLLAAIRFGGRFQTRLNQSTKTPHLGAPRWIRRIERRLGEALLEVLEDHRRVGEDEIAVDEDGHELLAADREDRAPVAVVDSTDSTATPLWASASATRSTFVENGNR